MGFPVTNEPTDGLETMYFVSLRPFGVMLLYNTAITSVTSLVSEQVLMLAGAVLQSYYIK